MALANSATESTTSPNGWRICGREKRSARRSEQTPWPSPHSSMIKMEKLAITVKSAVDHPMPDARIYVAYVDEITTRGLINEILPLSGVIELAVEPDRALVVLGRWWSGYGGSAGVLSRSLVSCRRGWAHTIYP
jgi:hypothetical protein